MAERKRLDVVLLERGLMPTRSRAQAAIAAGLVTIDGRVATRPAEPVEPGACVEARESHPWVSRGGVKLAAALDAFDVSPAGRHCLDVGASTGGFTDVLLTRGARFVTAVDVGHGQLAAALARDPRVRSMESTDARALRSAMFDPAPDLLVADVSFVSLSKVIAAPIACLARPADAIVLIKPQFEVGRGAVGKGGIVPEHAAREAIHHVVAGLRDDHGLDVRGIVDSPIRGGDGNFEALVHAVLPALGT
jgi:23S rRNA (cytidine1920-2'-O)/16S rRNA (cytidine1409-2'-O)-methyltransferase